MKMTLHEGAEATLAAASRLAASQLSWDHQIQRVDAETARTNNMPWLVEPTMRQAVDERKLQLRKQRYALDTAQLQIYLVDAEIARTVNTPWKVDPAMKDKVEARKLELKQLKD